MSCNNDWDPLEEIIVGTADYCNIPIPNISTLKCQYPEFEEEYVKSVAGYYPQQILDEQNEDLEELYMIGHDLVSDTDNINNMYKSTQNYADEKNKPIPSVNWISQWQTLMREFPKVKFVKVNPNGIRGNTPVSSNIEEWNTQATKGTLEYWNYKKLNETFNCI